MGRCPARTAFELITAAHFERVYADARAFLFINPDKTTSGEAPAKEISWPTAFHSARDARKTSKPERPLRICSGDGCRRAGYCHRAGRQSAGWIARSGCWQMASRSIDRRRSTRPRRWLSTTGPRAGRKSDGTRHRADCGNLACAAAGKTRRQHGRGQKTN